MQYQGLPDLNEFLNGGNNYDQLPQQINNNPPEQINLNPPQQIHPNPNQYFNPNPHEQIDPNLQIGPNNPQIQIEGLVNVQQPQHYPVNPASPVNQINPDEHQGMRDKSNCCIYIILPLFLILLSLVRVVFALVFSLIPGGAIWIVAFIIFCVALCYICTNQPKTLKRLMMKIFFFSALVDLVGILYCVIYLSVNGDTNTNSDSTCSSSSNASTDTSINTSGYEYGFDYASELIQSNCQTTSTTTTSNTIPSTVLMIILIVYTVLIYICFSCILCWTERKLSASPQLVLPPMQMPVENLYQQPAQNIIIIQRQININA